MHVDQASHRSFPSEVAENLALKSALSLKVEVFLTHDNEMGEPAVILIQ
jgi:hypothetical protein